MLDRLSPRARSRRPRQRKGRGMASGQGRTCGRGQKGAGSRSGSKKRPWYEGGQMPMSRRLPKVGFKNLFRIEHAVVNVKDLARFEAGSVVDAEALAGAGLVSRSAERVKVLSMGDVTAALTLRVDAISAAARQKVEGAGGSIELVQRSPKGPVKGGAKAKKKGGAVSKEETPTGEGTEGS